MIKGGLEGRLRRTTRWLALIVVNAGLTILLLEGALRLVRIPGFSDYIDAIAILRGQRESYRHDPVGNMGVFPPNETFTWTIMDGKFEISTVAFPDNDTLGLRDDGLNASAPYKVFACGDSFTFGFGVDDDEVWHEILEQRYGSDVDIFNLRGIGNSISEIYERYPRYKDRFAHDTVFLGIYLGNEFIQSYPSRQNNPRVETSQPEAATVVEQSATGRIYHFLRHYSYSARLLKYLLFKQLIKIGYYNYDVEREVYQPENSPFVFTIDYEEEILVRTCLREYSESMQSNVQAFEQSVARLAELIREDERRVFAFIFPFKEQVYWEQWAFRLENPDDYDPLKPNRIVRDALQRARVPYFDLTEDMIEAGSTQVLYWPIDSHWNPAGNRLAAELIHTWLEERGFPRFENKGRSRK